MRVFHTAGLFLPGVYLPFLYDIVRPGGSLDRLGVGEKKVSAAAVENLLRWRHILVAVSIPPALYCLLLADVIPYVMFVVLPGVLGGADLAEFEDYDVSYPFLSTFLGFLSSFSIVITGVLGYPAIMAWCELYISLLLYISFLSCHVW